MDTVGLVYPELSYRLLGLAFKVFNELGYGLPEKHYQAACAQIFTKEKISFKREQFVMLTFNGEPLAKLYMDFVIDEKIVLELKVSPKLGYVHVKQVVAYLKASNLKLAIIIYFTRDGVKSRRIINAI